MARRPNKHQRKARPLGAGRLVRRTQRRDGSYLVREVPADRALKAYTCPGCHATIAPGTAHLVAWAERPGFGSGSGLDERRHWHPHCWRMAQ